ncbi:MAG: hypothetical protein HPY55_06650 [Firmicutes bacterium]|nr:hypothetical protein [Bacillota bacterium]
MKRVYSKFARGTGCDLRAEGPSSPVRVYKPGDVEWCPNCRRSPSAARPVVSLKGKLRLNKAAAALLREIGGERMRLDIGYEGAARRLVIQPAEHGRYRLSISPDRTCSVGGRLLVAWLSDRAITAGEYPCYRDGQRLVVDVQSGGRVSGGKG